MYLKEVYDSPYNRHPEVCGAYHIPPDLMINDCTLREGEQTAAANFTLDEKLETRDPQPVTRNTLCAILSAPCANVQGATRNPQRGTDSTDLTD